MGKIQIEKRVLGMLRSNCYLVVNKETKEAVMIDPADEAEALKADIQALGIKPVGILLTHGHYDHMGAAMELSLHYQIRIGVGAEEVDVMSDAGKNLSIQFARPFEVNGDEFYRDNEEIVLAGFKIQVLHTPGHTKGGVCYYFTEAGALFSGDTLFCESVGRSDFPTGSMSDLVRSVRHLLKTLPDSTAVYPGHEAETSIAHEKEYNPFI